MLRGKRERRGGSVKQHLPSASTSSGVKHQHFAKQTLTLLFSVICQQSQRSVWTVCVVQSLAPIPYMDLSFMQHR